MATKSHRELAYLFAGDMSAKLDVNVIVVCVLVFLRPSS